MVTLVSGAGAIVINDVIDVGGGNAAGTTEACPPGTPTTPVLARPVCVSIPHFFSDSATSAAVRLSSKASSGWAS